MPSCAEPRLRGRPLIRDCLQRELPLRWPEEGRTDLLRRLALEIGAIAEQAVAFFQMAEAWDEAEKRLVAEAPALFREGRLGTLRTALGGFPGEWRNRSAWLAYIEAEAQRREGHLDVAYQTFLRAEKLAGEGPAAGWVATGLAAVHGARGHVDAEACFGRALGHFGADSDFAGQARVQYNLGLLFARQGDFERASAPYREAIRLSEAGGLLPLALTYNNLALCLFYMGHADRAWKEVEKGMALAERLASARDRMFLLRTLGHLEVAAGKLAAAREHYEQALADATALGDQHSQVHAQLGLARVALGEGDAPGALGSAQQALAQLGGAAPSTEGRVVGADEKDPDLGEPLTLLAEIHLVAGRPAAAAAHLEVAEELIRRHPNSYQRSLLQSLRRRLEGQDSPEAARDGGGEAPLVIRCFGVSGATLDGRELEAKDWRSKNAKLVLGYLLVHPEGATKETLAELLYGGADTSRSTVHVAISRLRQALEPAMGKEPSRLVLFEEGRYIFNRAAQVAVDMWEFRQAVRQAAVAGANGAALRERALTLYKGPFLADFSDVRWVQEQQEYFRRLAAGVFEGCCAAAAAEDRWEQVEDLAERHLAVDQAAVGAYRARVVALAMRERPAEALKAAELAAGRLEHDVGLLPEDLLELADAIRDGSLTVRRARAFLGA